MLLAEGSIVAEIELFGKHFGYDSSLKFQNSVKLFSWFTGYKNALNLEICLWWGSSAVVKR